MSIDIFFYSDDLAHLKDAAFIPKTCKHLHQCRGSDSVSINIFYSNALAHLIYAAADIVLVPSMFEPCGLTQLVAMR